MMFLEEEKKQRLYILQERINQQAMRGAAVLAPPSVFWQKVHRVRASWSFPVVLKITAWLTLKARRYDR